MSRKTITVYDSYILLPWFLTEKSRMFLHTTLEASLSFREFRYTRQCFSYKNRNEKRDTLQQKNLNLKNPEWKDSKKFPWESLVNYLSVLCKMLCKIFLWMSPVISLFTVFGMLWCNTWYIVVLHCECWQNSSWKRSGFATGGNQLWIKATVYLY